MENRARKKQGRGNDDLWKAWENDKTVFPPFPQPLEIAAAIPTLPPSRLRRASIALNVRQTKTRGMMHNITTQVGQIR
jgi:hypothetical protein